VGMERGALSLVNITEELLEWKSSGSGSRKPRLTAVGIRCADKDKDKTMDNAQKLNICSNVPSSQIFISCQLARKICSHRFKHNIMYNFFLIHLLVFREIT
jgi:hypothetical protein